jgi:hypothetical protein
LLRLAVFLIFELSYIALAIVCLVKPIILPSSLTPSESKGGLTVLFILWQTVAIFPIRDVVVHAFSGEWSIQLSRTGKLVPGTTDRVSTLTAGILDQVVHSFTGTASWSFRMAFAASLALMLLSGLAPGTFSPANIFADVPIQLPIGNFTLTDIDPSGALDGIAVFPMERAALVTRLEQIEKSPFGYDVTTGNWIVGWPPVGLYANVNLEYPSDGVHFQHSCHWEAPVVNVSRGTWTTSQRTWVVWLDIMLATNPGLNPNARRLLQALT